MNSITSVTHWLILGMVVLQVSELLCMQAVLF